MPKEIKSIPTLVSILLGIANRVHKKHLYYCNSYAEHKILEDVYKTIRDAADRVAELCLARDIFKIEREHTYKNIPGYPIENPKDALFYIDKAVSILKDIRVDVNIDQATQSSIDSFVEKLLVSKYLLKIEYKMLPKLKSATEVVQPTDIPKFTIPQFKQAIKYKFYGRNVEFFNVESENNKCKYTIAVDGALQQGTLDAEKFINAILKTRKQHRDNIIEIIKKDANKPYVASVGFDNLDKLVLFKDDKVKQKLFETENAYSKFIDFYMKSLFTKKHYFANPTLQFTVAWLNEPTKVALESAIDKITELSTREVYENDEVPYLNIFGLTIPEPIFELQYPKLLLCRPMITGIKKVEIKHKEQTVIEVCLVLSQVINFRYRYNVTSIPTDSSDNPLYNLNEQESFYDLDNPEKIKSVTPIIVPNTKTKITF